ncbi:MULTISPECIES: DUF6325 family protein [unclassified Streptomyces]|uniref:DUF6325 family protein n=1 Tax=unclassified Streptomyces TaxID=2593676 RepID=UPI002E374AD6|nr:DUF6325 family protein [Streptomyces sp. NBC_01268]
MDVGPVEYVVIAFPGNRFRGEIAPELRNLVASGTVRILDLTFIKKESDGSVSYVELDALDPTEASVFDDIDGEIGGLFSDQDLALIAEELAPDSSAAVLLWEDTWAAGITGAIRRAGGELLAHERIPAEAVERAYEDAA